MDERETLVCAKAEWKLPLFLCTQIQSHKTLVKYLAEFFLSPQYLNIKLTFILQCSCSNITAVMHVIILQFYTHKYAYKVCTDTEDAHSLSWRACSCFGRKQPSASYDKASNSQCRMRVSTALQFKQYTACGELQGVVGITLTNLAGSGGAGDAQGSSTRRCCQCPFRRI